MDDHQEKAIILIDKDIAEKGYKFIYYEAEDCERCPYKDVCTGKLYQGRVYEVIDVIKTKKKMICPIIKSEVVPVEVKLADIEAAVSTKNALDNIIIKWNNPTCENYSCIFRTLCFPKGLKRGDKIKIKKVREKIQCPLNYDITHVTVQLLL